MTPNGKDKEKMEKPKITKSIKREIAILAKFHSGGFFKRKKKKNE